MIFLDTSAIYALADEADAQHERAIRLFQSARQSSRPIVTHSYVLVESAALLHRRLGKKVALDFLEQAGRFRIHWVSADLHHEGVAYLSEHDGSKLSLVDAVSFLVMKQAGVTEYLGFDRHFTDAGFNQFVGQ